MFGVSFSEVLLIAMVALIVVGPKRLPTMLGTMGKWVGKLRNISTEMRSQMGMDEFLRKEGLHGGLHELRNLMRGGIAGAALSPAPNNTGSTTRALYSDSREVNDDRSREYPPEGPDAYGALPDDLIDDEPSRAPIAPLSPTTEAEPATGGVTLEATPAAQPDKADA